VQTYKDQKESARLRIEQEESEKVDNVGYSAGAEENVVTAGVGSSQYGMSLKATQHGKKKKNVLDTTTFNDIRPKPSDGSKDYINNHTPSDFKGFSFYVMADTPQTETEENTLKSQMKKLSDYTKNNSKRNIALGIHLGGTQKSSQCAESTYEKHAQLIAKGPRPTFVTPGKSDWFDCPRQEEAFGFFQKHLGPELQSRWPKNQLENLGLFQRSQNHPELFRLCVEGILFVGLHMIDPPGSQESTSLRDNRMEASMQWLAESIEESFAGREIRGVVILGHVGRSDHNEPFFAHTRKYFDTNSSTSSSSTRQNLPVLYLHGDGLTWNVDKNLSPFYDVQVHKGGSAEPLLIDVAPQIKGEVKGLHRHKGGLVTILGKGLFRLDQQQGRYKDADPTKKPKRHV
jgi:hypothetical protein